MKKVDVTYLNFVVSVRRLVAGETFLAETYGGFSRKVVEEDGIVVKDGSGREIFVPSRFLEPKR